MSSNYDPKSFEDATSSKSGKHNFYANKSVGGKSRQSRMNLSKTGNEIKIDGLKAEDEYKDSIPFVQDEFNRQDIEMEQFKEERVKKTQKYVESLVTGNFHQVKLDFDPNKDTAYSTAIDTDGDSIISTQELNDY